MFSPPMSRFCPRFDATLRNSRCRSPPPVHRSCLAQRPDTVGITLSDGVTRDVSSCRVLAIPFDSRTCRYLPQGGVHRKWAAFKRSNDLSSTPIAAWTAATSSDRQPTCVYRAVDTVAEVLRGAAVSAVAAVSISTSDGSKRYGCSPIEFLP
jgi:hypothetical protein